MTYNNWVYIAVMAAVSYACLLYTSDAADDSVLV